MKYVFIQEHDSQHSVVLLCEALGVSRGGYYSWLSRAESQRVRKDRQLLPRIRVAFRESRQRYGSPRVHAQLREEGICCGRRRVARLMRQDRLQARPRRRFKSTTQSAHIQEVAANELQRRFEVATLGTCWAGDSPTSGRRRAGCTWRSCWTCVPVGSSVGRSVTGSPKS